MDTIVNPLRSGVKKVVSTDGIVEGIKKAVRSVSIQYQKKLKLKSERKNMEISKSSFAFTLHLR